MGWFSRILKPVRRTVDVLGTVVSFLPLPPAVKKIIRIADRVEDALPDDDKPDTG